MLGEFGLRAEADRGSRSSIERLPAARAAFVGRTLRGPVNEPRLIVSFTQFQQVFGGLWQPSPLGYAVEQFFDNGGQEAYIVRVANGARPASVTLPAGDGQALVLHAARPGTREFLRVCIDYDNLPADDPAAFNLAVQRVRSAGAVHVEDQEIHRELSVRPDAPRYAPRVLAASQLVRADAPVPRTRPLRTIDRGSGLATGYVHSNADGDDGAPLSDYDLIGSEIDATGLFALRDEHFFNFLCIPPIARERDLGVQTLVVAARLCRERRALLIVDPPGAWNTAGEALAGLRAWGFRSEDAALYFPRLLAYDKLRGRFETFAPCGAAAGLLARRDSQTPVWQADETDDPVLRPGYKPACPVNETERARLAAAGVNTLQAVRAAARRALPARTFASAGAVDGGGLAARRSVPYIIHCIERGTRWAAAAAREVDTAAVLEAHVRGFLTELHQAGAFAGRSLDDAFFLKCPVAAGPDGEAAHPVRSIHFLVGLAAARQGEFHCFRIIHGAAGSEVRGVTLNRLRDLRASPAEIEWADRIADQLRC